MAVKLVSKGNFNKTSSWLLKLKDRRYLKVLDKYGQLGVQALADATPVDSGLTAASWFYEIQNEGNNVRLVFYNTNENKGVPIAILLQYGHGTGTGGWVEGRDYINPAIRPIFDELAKKAWMEVTSV